VEDSMASASGQKQKEKIEAVVVERDESEIEKIQQNEDNSIDATIAADANSKVC
jgi:hypothetical protein